MIREDNSIRLQPCQSPVWDTALTLRGLVARPDGSSVISGYRTGETGDADSLGRDLGVELRRRAGPGFFDPPS